MWIAFKVKDKGFLCHGRKKRNCALRGWMGHCRREKWRGGAALFGVQLSAAGLHILYWETTALQSVPVHACMSHGVGMLASGTQQFTALTSVNKLIAEDWGTTQPLRWNCSLLLRRTAERQNGQIYMMGGISQLLCHCRNVIHFNTKGKGGTHWKDFW